MPSRSHNATFSQNIMLNGMHIARIHNNILPRLISRIYGELLNKLTNSLRCGTRSSAIDATKWRHQCHLRRWTNCYQLKHNNITILNALTDITTDCKVQCNLQRELVTDAYKIINGLSISVEKKQYYQRNKYGWYQAWNWIQNWEGELAGLRSRSTSRCKFVVCLPVYGMNGTFDARATWRLLLTTTRSFQVTLLCWDDVTVILQRSTWQPNKLAVEFFWLAYLALIKCLNHSSQGAPNHARSTNTIEPLLSQVTLIQ